MTSLDQKQRERSILDFYLRMAGLEGTVATQESPDFVVTIGARRIGIEITEYHQPTNPRARFSRTQVEAEWDKIRAAVVKYRESHEGLEDLNVLLSFADLVVPSAKQRHHFVQAIHNEIERVRPDLSHRFTTIRIDDRHPVVLRRYLEKIDVCVADCYMEWDWSHMTGWVGTSDDELVSILSPKLALNRADEIDELHLVVAADGSTVGSYIGYLSAQWLNDWSCTNTVLHRSDYSVVAIINHGQTCVWRQCGGWFDVKHN